MKRRGGLEGVCAANVASGEDHGACPAPTHLAHGTGNALADSQDKLLSLPGKRRAGLLGTISDDPSENYVDFFGRVYIHRRLISPGYNAGTKCKISENIQYDGQNTAR